MILYYDRNLWNVFCSADCEQETTLETWGQKSDGKMNRVHKDLAFSYILSLQSWALYIDQIVDV